MTINSNLTKVDYDWKRNFNILGNKIHSELEKQEFYPKLNQRKFRPESTNSLGYLSKLFTIKNAPGRIIIWLDNFTNHDKPTISISYEINNAKSIKAVAKRLENFNTIQTLNESIIQPTQNSIYILNKPLAKKHFDLFLIESYEKENYLTIFLSDRLTKSLNSKTLITNITKYISLITRIIIGINLKNTTNATVTENNKKLAKHLLRERKMKFTEDAKFRDNYICKICNFNADRVYGKTGFAALEVHHIKPLSHSKEQVKTQLKNLITLCANCHSMVHNLGGSKQHIAKLKKTINS